MRLLHPDLALLLPAPGGIGDDVIGERLTQLGANHYDTVDFDRYPADGKSSRTAGKQVIYSAERIREDVHRRLSFAAAESGYKVVVLTDADRLNTQAANALLKLLEEPRPRTVLILTTEHPDALLPTIRSRCQSVRFRPLSVEEIQEALLSRTEVAPSSALSLARMANGSFSRALELALNPDLMRLRAEVVRFLRVAWASLAPDVVRLSEDLNRLSREQLRFFFQLLLVWLRDLMMIRLMGSEAAVVNEDQLETISKFSKNLPEACVEDMIARVEETERLIGRNVNARLALIVLSNDLAAAMRGTR